MTWREVTKNAHGRWVLAFCFATLAMMVLYMPTYYREVIGPKAGILLDDPVLNYFEPVDWSTAVFAILTIAILQTLITYAVSPAVILTGLMTYCVINIVRMLTMYMITLEPPSDMILLIDPFSATLVYPDSGFAKDLFFSGHVSTMMIMVFVEKNKVWYMTKLAGTAAMALFLAWQHVHYTVDLLVAPIATYLAYLAARRFIANLAGQNHSKQQKNT